MTRSSAASLAWWHHRPRSPECHHPSPRRPAATVVARQRNPAPAKSKAHRYPRCWRCGFPLRPLVTCLPKLSIEEVPTLTNHDKKTFQFESCATQTKDHYDACFEKLFFPLPCRCFNMHLLHALIDHNFSRTTCQPQIQEAVVPSFAWLHGCTAKCRLSLLRQVTRTTRKSPSELPYSTLILFVSFCHGIQNLTSTMFQNSYTMYLCTVILCFSPQHFSYAKKPDCLKYSPSYCDLCETLTPRVGAGPSWPQLAVLVFYPWWWCQQRAQSARLPKFTPQLCRNRPNTIQSKVHCVGVCAEKGR